jgi:thiol-disulfide isomerase/thioredoxin
MKTRLAASAALGLLLAVPLAAHTQDKPTIVKENLPKKAVCLVCSQGGEEHGEEKPAGAVTYKGKTYYFCNKTEVANFVKAPDAYLPAPLPRNAPAFTLKNVVGESVTLVELSKGKVLLVDFWATWCGPCVKAMPDLQKLHDKLSSNGKFSVVGISIDEEGVKKVQPFLAKSKTKYSYPILLDTSDTWKQWGVKALPTLLLVKDGQIVNSWTGKIDQKAVEAAVAKVVPPPNG